MSIYLICIFVLLGMFVAIISGFVFIFIRHRNKHSKVKIENLLQRKSSLYVKYNLDKNEIIINNYTYLNVDISKLILNISKRADFLKKVKECLKNRNTKFSFNEKIEDFLYEFTFSYRNDEDNIVVLRCDYNIEKTMAPVLTKSIDDIKKIHQQSRQKKGAFYYLNVKDFNSINQRYGQECGDYVLEVLKSRLLKLEKNNIYCSYLGSDEFAIFVNKKINKKKAVLLIQNFLKKITKTIDIGYITIDLVIGVGVCIGKYEELADFIDSAYVASEYAKKRKKYNIVIYNEEMKLEENIIDVCDNELDLIVHNKEVDVNYSPVFYYDKIKFIGYISKPTFENSLITFDKLKNVAIKNSLIDKFMSIVIDNQLVNYMKKRPNKNSKLFINLKLEDLSTFLEIYLSNPSYSDCKIVICLNVKKGYEMINKFSNISSNISKVIEEGIEFALEIDTNNMYDYDYILKNAKYLILDSNTVKNMNNALVKNKAMNISELAKNYNLELLAIDVEEYIQFENLLKYDVHYFSGSYFGKSTKKPGEIEQSKTRIFAKLTKDSKKNKKN